MFGYIVINKSELRFREFDVYHSYYCGLCKGLKKRCGRKGQLTLSYDMTFLVMLLSGLYEPETSWDTENCIVHPFRKQEVRTNKFTEYVADMNLLLSYYKCKDDWVDEKKVTRLAYAKLLEATCRKMDALYQGKVSRIDELLREISNGEKTCDYNVDHMSGLFGEIMAEIFAWRRDEWEGSLRKMGFYLGKFVYLMDAYEDLEQDKKKGRYNPLLSMAEEPDFEENVSRVLELLMAECSREFETLPILEHVEILRNILYSGVWYRYETIQRKKEEKRMKRDE